MNSLNSRKNKLSPLVSDEDMQLLSTIRRITKQGYDAEIKRNKDGGLSVYEIRKKREI